MTASDRLPGVNVVGYFATESGVGEWARSTIEVLRSVDIRYRLIPNTATVSRQSHVLADNTSMGEFGEINLIHVNADQLRQFARTTDGGLLASHYTIGLWAWEVAEFPRWMAQSAGLLDEVWAVSSFAAAAIGRKISKPVHVFAPRIVVPEAPLISREDMKLPGGFLFLFTFDYLSVAERKNPLGVVSAYRRAFRPDDGCALVIKGINPRFDQQASDRLHQAVSDRGDIVLIEEYGSLIDQWSLVGTCDAYVSLHRAEGFGLTLAEAMALGKPVIATRWSGNLDFMDETNSYLVPCTMMRIGGGHSPYPPRGRWADPDLDQAVDILRHVRDHGGDVLARAERARSDIASFHGTEARAAFITERLTAVRHAVPGPRKAPPPGRSPTLKRIAARARRMLRGSVVA